MKKTMFILLLLSIAINSFGQDDNYPMGLVMDDKAYSDVPEQAQQLTRDYTILPRSYSLQKYCPTPMNQGNYGTCTSWASAYAARTIVAAIQHGWTNKIIINREAFSPPFVYRQIKDSGDSNCQNGSCIDDAMELLKTKGVPKYSLFNPMCASYIPTYLFTSAYDNRIDNYFRLFAIDDNENTKVQKTKKALSENCPVVIGMNCYSSFSSAKDCWNGIKDNYRGGHAMCVVGYDDDKYGGAVLIMNSWGTNWGNGGFTWVRYKDFASSTKYAYQLYVRGLNPSPQPAPTPQPTPTKNETSITWLGASTTYSYKYIIKAGIKAKNKVTSIAVLVNGTRLRGIGAVTNDGFQHVVNMEVSLVEGRNNITIEATTAGGTTRLEKTVTCTPTKRNDLMGSFYVQLSTGEKMNVNLSSVKDLPVYKVSGSYISGTRYRVYISNNEPAYVYVIASDQLNNISKVFPPADNISPALVYKSNNIALPDEKWYMEMDNTVGTDYLCVLYSKEALNIRNIIDRLKLTSGNFSQRLKLILEKDLVPYQDIVLGKSTVSFKANTLKSVVPIVLEITHK